LLYRARYVENLKTGINKIKSLIEETSPGRKVGFLFDSQTFRVIFIRDVLNDAVKNRLSKKLNVVIENKEATSTQIMKAIENLNLIKDALPQPICGEKGN
jgi:hypothetical protein